MSVTASRRTRRRTGPALTAVVALAVLVAAVLVPFLVLKAAHTIANSKEGRAVTVAGNEPVALLPDSRGALLVPLDRAGDPAGFVVLAVTPDRAGGAIVLVPAATETQVPGIPDPARMRDGHDVAGLQGATEAVSGYLAVSLPVAQEAASEALATLLSPYAPFAVRLDEDVVDTASNGTELLLSEAGSTSLTAEQMARLLVARRAGESEYARLPRVTALWKAVADAVTSARAARGVLPLDDIGSFLERMAGGPVSVHELPVEPVLDPASNPDAIDLLRADAVKGRILMARYLPGALATVGSGLRVRLVDPSNDEHLLEVAVARLWYAGANVILLGSGGPVPDTTTIAYAHATDEALAQVYAKFFGGADISLGGDKIDGIDATVTLGRSFAESVKAYEEAAAATSSTSSSSTTVDSTSTTVRSSSSTTVKRTTTTTEKKGGG
ncbi:MAG TPA: hypothetical protein VF855_08400 [Acidimicrobiales bacterium]